MFFVMIGQIMMCWRFKILCSLKWRYKRSKNHLNIWVWQPIEYHQKYTISKLSGLIEPVLLRVLPINSNSWLWQCRMFFCHKWVWSLVTSWSLLRGCNFLKKSCLILLVDTIGFGNDRNLWSEMMVLWPLVSGSKQIWALPF